MRRGAPRVVEAQTVDVILETLAAGVVRRDELPRRLGLEEEVTHRLMRRLVDDQRVHSDGRYWILGSRKR